MSQVAISRGKLINPAGVVEADRTIGSNDR
jgi:hypothetical protein